MNKNISIDLKFGKETKKLVVSQKNVIDILKMRNIPSSQNPHKMIKGKLRTPIGAKPLTKLLLQKNPQQIVIIVSDITRPGPFNLLLEALLEEINSVEIQFAIQIIIANGTHRKMTDQEKRFHYGDFVVDNYQVSNHDCRADDLVDMGEMKSGNRLLINRKVIEADFVITVGSINPHYFAGFSGGRKSILPGVSGYSTTRENHSNIIYKYARLGKLAGNKIHLEMSEAAHKVGVDFTLNMVLNRRKEIIDCVAGDIEKSFLKGIEEYKNYNSVQFSELADVIFTSTGGYPKDMSFYQSQRTLNNVIGMLKQGGTIVISTESGEGIGQDDMEKVLKSAKCVDDLFKVKKSEIQIGGHRAFATGKLLKKADILVLSNMPDKLVEDVHFTPIASFEKAVRFIKKKHGQNFRSYIIPNGTMLFPVKKVSHQ
ncbi:MAG: nickel-dependent lactate racemase [Candidatus Cloacimonadota bacterium]|nr:nickel-dependent lactate racemase [Candidatus Cloacimonadota bacterium]